MERASGEARPIVTPVSIFLGSSTEALPIAQQVQSELQPFARAKVWNQGTFKLGEGGLQSLIDELARHDFAILVFSPDDITNSRDKSTTSPRDNVVFELGLFMGRLGPRRTFVLYDRTADLRILSDLSGVTLAPYDGKWASVDLPAAIGAACNPIRRAIRLAGPIQKPLALIESPSFLLASALKDERFLEADRAAIIESGLSRPDTEPDVSADRLRLLLSSKRYDIVQLTLDVFSDGSVCFHSPAASSAKGAQTAYPQTGLSSF